MMDYAAIEQAALAMSMDDRWDLGFLLLDTLDGLSEKDLASALPPTGAHWQLAGKLSGQIDSKLAQAALSLPVKERDMLATVLIHSLDEGILGEVVTVMEAKAAWRVEIERRTKDLESGKARTIPWEEVKRKGRELLDELRKAKRTDQNQFDTERHWILLTPERLRRGDDGFLRDSRNGYGFAR